MPKKLLIVQVAALGWDFLEAGGVTKVGGLEFQPCDSLFPALTCPAQATMRTATHPQDHGIVMNGIYSRQLRRPGFWEQSCALVEGERVWTKARESGASIGMLFWQQSLGESVDVLLSPWPVHKHHGGLVDITHSRPEHLYGELCKRTGSKFHLRHYWGPLAQYQASGWVGCATAELLGMPEAPDILFSYLPHLDYDLQRYAADHSRNINARAQLLSLLQLLWDSAEANGYDVVVFGDYAIGPTKRVVFPNRVLHDAGLFQLRDVSGMLYPNFHDSAAFAIVDHEIAHVYVEDVSRLDEVKSVLVNLGDDVEVLDVDAQEALKMAHGNGGDLVLVGKPGTWFAYPWWDNPKDAPDYATHIDIHNKPGYDPCELFSTWNLFKISTDTSRIMGSHGAVGPERKVAWAASCKLDREPVDIADLALALRENIARVKR